MFFKICLSNLVQRVCVDGCFSDFNFVVSCAPQGGVLGPLLFANLLLGAGIGYETQCRKIKSIIISRSRTIFPPHLDLFILDDLLENVEHLKPLGVILDPRLTFASKHLVIFCTYQTYAPMTVMF